LTDEKDTFDIIPELYGRYSHRDDEEIKETEECKEKRIINVSDYKLLRPDNEGTYGNNLVATGKNITQPIRRVIFLAENGNSKANRNYSNYSTDVDGKNNESPCSTWSLTIGNIHKVKDQLCSRSRFISAWYATEGSYPIKPGIHSFNISKASCSRDNVETLTAKDGEIKVSIRLDSANKKERQTPIKYSLSVFLHLVHIVEFRYDGKKWIIINR
jgi:hypothetical protein